MFYFLYLFKYMNDLLESGDRNVTDHLGVVMSPPIQLYWVMSELEEIRQSGERYIK